VKKPEILMELLIFLPSLCYYCTVTLLQSSNCNLAIFPKGGSTVV